MKWLIFGHRKMAIASVSASVLVLFTALWDVGNSVSMRGGCEAVRPLCSVGTRVRQHLDLSYVVLDKLPSLSGSCIFSVI